MLDRSKRIVLFSIWLDHAFTYTTRDFRHDNKYDARISRKEFNIEKKKNSRNFSNFHEKFRPRFPRTCETFEEKEGEEGERYTTRFVTFEREAIK